MSEKSAENFRSVVASPTRIEDELSKTQCDFYDAFLGGWAKGSTQTCSSTTNSDKQPSAEQMLSEMRRAKRALLDEYANMALRELERMAFVINILPVVPDTPFTGRSKPARRAMARLAARRCR